MASDIPKLIETINRVGIQNVSLLSRISGMPKETIRYVVKKRFPQLGLRVGMLVDYESLGLERYFAMLRFSPDMLEFASDVLDKLARVAFLTYRSGLAFEPWHVAMFAVPVSVADEFHSLLDRMVKAKVLMSVRAERLEWTRHTELKSRYHDFGSRTWKIDWDKVRTHEELPPSPPPAYEPAARPEIDVVDTLIIKELELDSLRNFADIARKLGINDRTLRWHYTNHVSPLISAYYVRWLPVAANELTKVLGLICEFSGLSRYRLSKVRRLFNTFPFAWYEGGRRDGYYQVQSGIPAEHLIESLQFLNKNLREMAPDWKTYVLDISTSYSYTLPYENFNSEEGWLFDKKKALNSLIFAKAPAKK